MEGLISGKSMGERMANALRLKTREVGCATPGNIVVNLDVDRSGVLTDTGYDINLLDA